MSGVYVYAYNAAGVSLSYSRPTDSNGKAFFALAADQQVKFSTTVAGTRYGSSVVTTPGAATITAAAAAAGVAEVIMEAAASAQPNEPNLYDLGSVQLGKAFRMKLELPDALLGQRRVTWKNRDAALLPVGVSCSRGKLGGKPSTAGLYTFSVTIEVTLKTVAAGGKKILSKQSVERSYQLRVIQP